MSDYARLAKNLRAIAHSDEYDGRNDGKETSTEWHAANVIECLIRERNEAALEARAKALEEAAAIADDVLGKNSFVGLAILALREKP